MGTSCPGDSSGKTAKIPDEPPNLPNSSGKKDEIPEESVHGEVMWFFLLAKKALSEMDPVESWFYILKNSGKFAEKPEGLEF